MTRGDFRSDSFVNECNSSLTGDPPVNKYRRTSCSRVYVERRLRRRFKTYVVKKFDVTRYKAPTLGIIALINADTVSPFDIPIVYRNSRKIRN